MSFADHVLILKVLIGKSDHELENILNFRIESELEDVFNQT